MQVGPTRFEEFQKMAEGLVEMSKLPDAASLYILQMRLIISQMNDTLTLIALENENERWR